MKLSLYCFFLFNMKVYKRYKNLFAEFFFQALILYLQIGGILDLCSQFVYGGIPWSFGIYFLIDFGQHKFRFLALVDFDNGQKLHLQLNLFSKSFYIGTVNVLHQRRDFSCKDIYQFLEFVIIFIC